MNFLTLPGGMTIIWTPSQRPANCPAAPTTTAPSGEINDFLVLKQVKIPIKQAGLRLSSHAFDLLNRFISMLLTRLPAAQQAWPCLHERLGECIVDLDLLPEARHGYLNAAQLEGRLGNNGEAIQGFVRCVNRLLDLLLAVTISLVESRGQSTIRQADLMQVLRKVPVLEPLRADLSGLEMVEAADKENVPPLSPTTPATPFCSPSQALAHNPQALQNAQNSQVLQNMHQNAPHHAPNLQDIPQAFQSAQVKTIVCLDSWLPWCQTMASSHGAFHLQTSLVQSTGVETDDFDCSLDQRAVLSAHLQSLIDRIVQLK